MPKTARDCGTGKPAARDCGAGEPTAFTVLLATVETQVAQSVERDKVLDAGKQLQGKVALNTARSLSGIWNVRQKVDGTNRTISELVQEIRINVTKVAMQLMQTSEKQARAAEEIGNPTYQRNKKARLSKGTNKKQMKNEAPLQSEARSSVDNGASMMKTAEETSLPEIARDSGAGEPAELSVLLSTVARQVAQTMERDKVLDTGNQLERKVTLKIARSLAATWNVRQKLGGANRTVSDMTEEVRINVTKAAMRLLQTREVQARGAEGSGIKTPRPYNNTVIRES